MARAGARLAQADSARRAAAAVTATEERGVRRAALDYVEGFYEGDTAKLVRSLRPDMFKYGYWREKGATAYAGEKMSYADALVYAAKFRAEKRTTPAAALREVTVLDVQNQTAAVKVRGWWGTDYLLLAKYDGQWKILHVMWQGP